MYFFEMVEEFAGPGKLVCGVYKNFIDKGNLQLFKILWYLLKG